MKLFQLFVAESLVLGPVREPSLLLVPPMKDEVKGIERTELEYQIWRESIDNLISDGPVSPPCQCPGNSWENLDSNEGTGDHEWFR